MVEMFFLEGVGRGVGRGRGVEVLCARGDSGWSRIDWSWGGGVEGGDKWCGYASDGVPAVDDSLLFKDLLARDVCQTTRAGLFCGVKVFETRTTLFHYGFGCP